MKTTVEKAIKLVGEGKNFAQASILVSSGSTPRSSGSWMVVEEDGKSEGTVGGGILEAAIIKASIKAIEEKQSRVIDVVLDGKDAAATGMICGGNAKVMVDYIDSKDKNNLVFYNELLYLIANDIPAKIATLVPDKNNPCKRNQCILKSDGTLIGQGGFNEDVIKTIEKSRNSYDSFTKMEKWEIYLEPIGQNGTVYIFGAGHCGEKLSPILKTIGFRVVVIDDRSEFANADRFPNADNIIVPKTFDDMCSSLHIDNESYLVVVTRGHMHDETVLRQCLKTNACYIGMIGSLPKRDAIYGHLLSDGYSQSDIDRVHSPIGLPILAETPEEIAISISAELIQVRAEIKRGKINK